MTRLRSCPRHAQGAYESGKENFGHASSAVCREDEHQEVSGAASSPYDAAQDIADIDRRLSALQDFLKAAKAPR